MSGFLIFWFKEDIYNIQGMDNLIMYFAWVSVSLYVCMYPINVKAAKPIRPKFFVGPHMTQGKVHG